jgi:acyl-CoA thioesterase I
MDIGMARPAARRFGWFASFAFGLCLGLPALAAEEGTPPALPPLSAACDVPANDIAVPAPLPNVATLLQKSRTIHILAIGSSSTYGIGASSGVKSYPAQLGNILEKALKDVDVEIVNRGVAGEVAETTADRIHSEVALSRPDLVLWQLGTNDAISRVAPEDFERTVRSTIEWLKADGIDVVLVGLQYSARLAKDSSYFAIREVLLKVATDENILYVRRYDAMQFIAKTRANLQFMSSDNFHLNDLGYQCMAEHVARAVIANLFIKRFRPTSE